MSVPQERTRAELPVVALKFPNKDGDESGGVVAPNLTRQSSKGGTDERGKANCRAIAECGCHSGNRMS